MVRLESQKAKDIDAYLATQGDAEIGKWPIEIGGQKHILPFYKLPLHLLCYNANNGRLAMDIREWQQEQAGQRLDGWDREHAAIIRDMLLRLDPEKTEVLKTDLGQKGQMEPGVITHDGVVINGNRRMAVLEILHQEEATGRWQFLEAVRLPRTISEKDLWRIEAGLQLSKDKVAEYHPVNELLKIKEGIDRGLTPEEVAAAMYAWKPAEIEEALGRLNLIDQFLEFFGQPHNYGLIKKFGLHEYFIDIQKRVIAPARRKGVRRRELAKRVQYAFALMRAGIRMQSSGQSRRKGFTHWDLRHLDEVYSDAHAKDAFTRKLKQEKDMRSVPDEDVIQDFKEAVEILEMREERDRPLRLIERAITALESIDMQSKHLHPELVLSALAKLASLVDSIQQQLGQGERDV